ncbi:MAG TPA: hypothetical protein VI583_13295 [Cyclobacteriaceae bacterium]|nr:hypothetical protein [Cyclobacteriaceae bacterium]
MRRPEVHKILIAAFLLIIFAAPLVTRNLHSHGNLASVKEGSLSHKSLVQPVKPCLICSFASENSISKTSERFIFIQDSDAVCINPDIEVPVKPRFEYFLLRAPPYYS